MVEKRVVRSAQQPGTCGGTFRLGKATIGTMYHSRRRARVSGQVHAPSSLVGSVTCTVIGRLMSRAV
jgi:hypothetical protein